MRARGPLRLKLLVLSELYLLLLIDGIVEVRGVVLDDHVLRARRAQRPLRAQRRHRELPLARGIVEHERERARRRPADEREARLADGLPRPVGAPLERVD